MTKNSIVCSVSGATLLLVAAVAWHWLAPITPSVAPNVLFQTLKGERISLHALRGKPVLVSFWATSCQSCVEEMPHLTELHQDLHPAGLEIVGVAMAYDPPNRVLELTEARQIPYDISLDMDSAIATAFDQVTLTPNTFLIDPDGNIVLHTLGKLDMAALRQQIETYL